MECRGSRFPRQSRPPLLPHLYGRCLPSIVRNKSKFDEVPPAAPVTLATLVSRTYRHVATTSSSHSRREWVSAALPLEQFLRLAEAPRGRSSASLVGQRTIDEDWTATEVITVSWKVLRSGRTSRHRRRARCCRCPVTRPSHLQRRQPRGPLCPVSQSET